MDAYLAVLDGVTLADLVAPASSAAQGALGAADCPTRPCCRHGRWPGNLARMASTASLSTKLIRIGAACWCWRWPPSA
jgi:hypothetical protein